MFILYVFFWSFTAKTPRQLDQICRLWKTNYIFTYSLLSCALHYSMRFHKFKIFINALSLFLYSVNIPNLLLYKIPKIHRNLLSIDIKKKCKFKSFLPSFVPQNNDGFKPKTMWQNVLHFAVSLICVHINWWTTSSFWLRTEDMIWMIVLILTKQELRHSRIVGVSRWFDH